MLSKGFGGAERSFVDTALALAARGHAVQALCHARFLKRDLLDNTPNLWLETITSGGEWDMVAPRRIASLIEIFASEVVHTQLKRAAWHGGRAVHLTGVPTISELHNYVQLDRYKYAHTLIGITEDQRQHVLRKGWHPNRVQVIPNFSRVVPVDQVRGFTAQPLRFLSYGRYVKKKGFDVLLRAFRLLLDSGVNAHLTLGGQGPEQRVLERLSAKLGVQDRVKMGVWIDDVPRALDAADVFVLPSRDEPFGIVMLEAMARGLPIISTRTQGPSQVLSDKSSCLVQVGSVGALYEAMRQIASEPVAAMARAAVALDMYRSKYCEEVVLPQIESLYEQVIGSSKAMTTGM